MNISDFRGVDLFGKGDVGASEDLPVVARQGTQKADVPLGINTYLDWDVDTDSALERKNVAGFGSKWSSLVVIRNAMEFVFEFGIRIRVTGFVTQTGNRAPSNAAGFGFG